MGKKKKISKPKPRLNRKKEKKENTRRLREIFENGILKRQQNSRDKCTIRGKMKKSLRRR